MTTGSMNLHAQLAELYRGLASTHGRLAASAADEYVDQHHSPLGSRLHCRLVRTGELPGFKAGRRILVRRGDIDSYLEKHRVAPSEPAGGADEEALLLSMLAKVGGRTA